MSRRLGAAVLMEGLQGEELSPGRGLVLGADHAAAVAGAAKQRRVRVQPCEERFYGEVREVGGAEVEHGGCGIISYPLEHLVGGGGEQVDLSVFVQVALAVAPDDDALDEKPAKQNSAFQNPTQRDLNDGVASLWP